MKCGSKREKSNAEFALDIKSIVIELDLKMHRIAKPIWDIKKEVVFPVTLEYSLKHLNKFVIVMSVCVSSLIYFGRNS